MITKERLEELIKQRAKIWGIGKSNNVFCVGLKFRTNTLRDTEWYKNKLEVYSKFFETKEEAEEYAEFGNITRTERLDLPMWCDIEKDFEKLKNGTYTIAEYKHLFSMNLKISNPGMSQILLYTEEAKFNWNLSRENYNEARRLCVKLFKGEKDG